MNEEEFKKNEVEFLINEIKIHDEVIKYPSQYFKWAVRAAKAMRKAKEEQARTKVIAAQEIKNIKEKYKESTGKEAAQTARYDSELSLSKKYQAQLQKQIEVEEEEDILVAARESMKAKRDMLVQFCMMYRQEISSDIIIKKKDRE